MKIAVIATGSRGDVQPYLALGKGLLDAGHTVQFVTHQNFDTLVQPYGLEFWPIEVNVQEIAQTAEMRDRIEGGNFLALMAQMAKEARRGAVLAAESSLNACQGADLILGGMGGLYIGLSLAEKFDLPFVQAYLVPFSPTRDFPSMIVPPLPAFLGKTLNRTTHHAARQMMWQGFRSADRLARTQVLGVAPGPIWGPYRSTHLRGMPTLYGFSPSVIPRPSDWSEEIHLTGYWFLENDDDWKPPSRLLQFMEAGPPPVYIGFGSMSNRDPEATAELILAALEQIDQRAILLSGWGGLQKTHLPESVLGVDSIPHNWLLPRMAGVVHHGGAGTTAAGLKAGVPSLVIPFFGDQPFWGRRIAELGVGPKPIPRRQLTSEKLAQAIQHMVNDQAMRQNAAAIGKMIQAEDGVARAVEIIDQL